MSSSSNSWRLAGTFARWISVLAALSLSSSCAGPSSRTDRISTATQALDAPAPATLSAEFDLDHSPVIERGTRCPQVAFGTTSYLVTHMDPVTPTPDQTLGQLAATRVDRSGNTLQTFDIPGAFVRSSNGCAPVVFAGGAFTTLWPAEDGTLRCTRLAEDGTLLNGAGASTGLSSVGIDSAMLDDTGNKMLVSMTDGKVALVGVDCSVIAAPLSLPATAGATRWPSGATFDGSQYWVAYSETSNGSADRFLLQAVSAAGTPSGTPVTIATAPWVRNSNSRVDLATQGSVATGGGKTVVGYRIFLKDDPGSFEANNDVHHAELSSTGVLGKNTSLKLFGWPATSKVGFTGDSFSIIWANGRRVKFLDDGTTALSSLGRSVSEPATVAFSRDGANVLLALGGTTVLVSTTGTRTVLPASFTQFLAADSSASGAKNLQQMSVHHEATVVASGAQSSLTVWLGPDQSFLGSRLSADGTILDDTPLAIHPANPIEDVTRPVVAASQTNFLVGWSEQSPGTGLSARLHAALVSGSGEVSKGFVVSEATFPPNSYVPQFKPVAASDGSDYLMVWAGGDVRAARVTSNREVLDQPPLILQSPAPGNYYAEEVSVAYDGAQYVVVSRELPPLHPELSITVPFVVQRVSKAGAKTLPVGTPWQASVGIVPNPPVITWGPGQGLVAFAQGPKLFVGRLNADLQPLDDPGILVTDHLNGSPNFSRGGTYGSVSLAWDGTNYWVSWRDIRRAQSDDIYAARVSTDGVVLDPLGVALSLSDVPPQLGWPGGVYGGLANCMLASAQGRVLAAYTHFNSAPDVYNFVQHGRWLSSGTPTGGAGGAGANAGGANGGTVGANGGTGSNAGVGGTNGGDGGANGGTFGANGGDVGTSGGVVGANGGAGGTNGGDVGTSGGVVGANGGAVETSGGGAGTSGGSVGTSGGIADAHAGTGGHNVEDAGGAGEAGSSGSLSPSDTGGASGSVDSTGGEGATGGAPMTSGGSTTISGGAPATPGSHSSHGSGCSVDTRGENPRLSLLWMGALALPLLRRALRPTASRVACTRS